MEQMEDGIFFSGYLIFFFQTANYGVPPKKKQGILNAFLSGKRKTPQILTAELQRFRLPRNPALSCVQCWNERAQRFSSRTLTSTNGLPV
jgi:hypothetical protein